MEDNNTDKDDILANFQAISGVTDVAESMALLESSDWDLNTAVNCALAMQTDGPQPQAQASSGNPWADFINPNDSPAGVNPFEELIAGRPIQRAVAVEVETSTHCPEEATSSKSSQLLNFVVTDEEAGTVHVLEVHPSQTLGDLLLECSVTFGHDVDTLRLCGWPCAPPTHAHTRFDQMSQLLSLSRTAPIQLQLLRLVDADVPLTEMHARAAQRRASPQASLPSSAAAAAASCPGAAAALAQSTPEKLARSYTLRIYVQGREEPLLWHMTGTDTVDKVKQDIYSLTNMAKRRQDWVGWPDGVNDDMVLGSLGLDAPEHVLRVSQTEQHNNGSAARRSAKQAAGSASNSRSNASPSSESESDDDFEQLAAHGHLDTDAVNDAAQCSVSNRLPLIPDDVQSVDEAMQNFVTVFESRYGVLHPHLAVCSLQLAVQQALDVPEPTERRPLLLYLHHDQSIASNVFASQVLCDPAVVQLINAQFVLWGWDVTFESNKKQLLDWSAQLGLDASQIYFQSIPVDQYPLILVLGKERGSLQLLHMIRGTQTSAQVMEILLDATTSFSVAVQDALQEQRERQTREAMRVEQESAFAQALAADQAKVQQQQQLIQQEQQAEELKQHALQQEESRRAALLLSLPAPPADGDASLMQIRLRCPGGGVESRCFRHSDQAKWLVAWADSLGYSPDDYKLLTSDRPRRNLEDLDTSKSFADLGIPKREQITIEEK